MARRIFLCAFHSSLLQCAFWQPPLHAFTLNDLKAIIAEEVGAPGKEFGTYTTEMDQQLTSDVSILMGCSAGKEEGLGESIKTSVAEVIDAIPAPFPASVVKNSIRKRIEKGALTVDEGEGFCFAVAHRTGCIKRAAKVEAGSIYVTTWQAGEIVDQRTDSYFCKRLSRNIGYFEVVELPSSHSGGIDGVSGCFEATVDGKLYSISMGRGASIAPEFAQTFTAETSLSDKGCIERGLGIDKED